LERLSSSCAERLSSWIAQEVRRRGTGGDEVRRASRSTAAGASSSSAAGAADIVILVFLRPFFVAFVIFVLNPKGF
jgi:hypothetical protein